MSQRHILIAWHTLRVLLTVTTFVVGWAAYSAWSRADGLGRTWVTAHAIAIRRNWESWANANELKLAALVPLNPEERIKALGPNEVFLERRERSGLLMTWGAGNPVQIPVSFGSPGALFSARGFHSIHGRLFHLAQVNLPDDEGNSADYVLAQEVTDSYVRQLLPAENAELVVYVGDEGVASTFTSASGSRVVPPLAPSTPLELADKEIAEGNVFFNYTARGEFYVPDYAGFAESPLAEKVHAGDSFVPCFFAFAQLGMTSQKSAVRVGVFLPEGRVMNEANDLAWVLFPISCLALLCVGLIPWPLLRRLKNVSAPPKPQEVPSFPPTGQEIHLSAPLGMKSHPSPSRPHSQSSEPTNAPGEHRKAG